MMLLLSSLTLRQLRFLINDIYIILGYCVSVSRFVRSRLAGFPSNVNVSLLTATETECNEITPLEKISVRIADTDR